MSDYYHLDVYKASYKLLVEIHKSFKNLNREYKYTIGEKVKERAFDVLVGIYKANRSKDKVACLYKALEDVEYVRLSLRLLRDLGAFGEKKFVRLMQISEDVFVQFEKWKNYEEKHSK